MSKINILLNENYTVLKIIHDNTVLLMGQKYCPLSQTDIASIANINRITCGNIINKLKNENLLEKETGSKKYILTKDAIKILKMLEKL